jgi:hypothetical protein
MATLLRSVKDAAKGALTAATDAPSVQALVSSAKNLSVDAKIAAGTALGCNCDGLRAGGKVNKPEWVCDGDKCVLVKATAVKGTGRRSAKGSARPKSTRRSTASAKKAASPVTKRTRRSTASAKKASAKKTASPAAKKAPATKKTAQGVTRPSARAMYDAGAGEGTEVTYSDGTVKCLNVDRNGRPYFGKC